MSPIEAARIALKYRTPVYLLSDGYLANGSEPLAPSRRRVAAGHLRGVRNRAERDGRRRRAHLLAVKRDPETLARPWRSPARRASSNRIGGLEKQDGIGTVSYEAREPRCDDPRPRGEDRRASRRA